MSTKIYRGVRFPRKRLAEFAEIARIRGLNRVYEAALDLAEKLQLNDERTGSIIEEQCRISKHEHKPGQDLPPEIEWRCRVAMTIKLIQVASAGTTRSMPLADLECGWRIWLPQRGRWVLALPWGEEHLDVRLPRWVEEYGYWDNTDPPEKVTSREWSARGRAWLIACAPNHQNHPLSLDVFTVDKDGYGVSMSWLELSLLEKGKRLKPGPSANYLRYREKLRRECEG